MATDPKAPQLGLFGVQPTVAPADWALAQGQLAARLPPKLALGTSSWSFPGWDKLVYDQHMSAQKLSRHGLEAFCKNPLLSTVSIDRGFYAPVPEKDFAHYRAQVPGTFRFVVKAWRHITTPVLNGQVNPDFLNPALARSAVIEPAQRGLQDRLDLVLFQFSPMHLGQIQGVQGFCEKLGAFLLQLPAQTRYAVEIRTPELLGPALREALVPSKSIYTINLLPAMPGLDAQFSRMQLKDQSRYLVRWLLAQGHEYQGALASFAPFNQLRVPCDRTVLRLAKFVRWAQAQDRHFTLQVNNKAEGCAPLTLQRVAAAIARLPPSEIATR